jgi:hypothetical protein
MSSFEMYFIMGMDIVRRTKETKMIEMMPHQPAIGTSFYIYTISVVTLPFNLSIPVLQPILRAIFVVLEVDTFMIVASNGGRAQRSAGHSYNRHCFASLENFQHMRLVRAPELIGEGHFML